MSSGNRRMFDSAASLIASTVVTSGLGFLYWVLAARVAPVEQVAAATAIVSAMTLLLNVGQFGFGTMLIAEGTGRVRRMGPLIAASLLVVMSASSALTVVFVVVVRMVDSTLARSLMGWPAVLALIAGVALGAAALVVDQALIGLALSPVQLYRNVVFATSKLVLCWGAAMAVELVTVGTILWAWVAGSALSLVAVLVDLRRRGRRVGFVPRPSALSGLGVRTADHNTVNLAQMLPRLGLPLLAALVLAEADYAAFFAAWMIASFLYMVPTHLSTAMFAIAVGDRTALAARLRAGLVVLLGPGVLGAFVIGGFASAWMGIFGPDYRIAATGLAVLAAGYLPCVLKELYIAVERVEGRLRVAGFVLIGTAVVELAGGVVGGMVAGIQGAAIGYVLGTCVLCPVYLRSIGKALAANHQAQGDRRLPGPGSTTSREGRMATW
ncbi:MAG: hypothetical protein QME79_13840 [Bacillota bacterium]|nr:hypothetical protein [Bacillota bacterium]